jgi:hypothetical protein
MKEHLLQTALKEKSFGRRLGILREYLQAQILAALQESGAMIPLAFHGGTALRFLHDLPRFSEDLDFALERPEGGGYDFPESLRKIRRSLEGQGFSVRLKISQKNVVHRAFVRVPEVLHESGLSPHSGAVLAVKLEVDTRPPAGAGLATTLVRRHRLLHLQHHDPPSLFAGKLHAVLVRPAVKGRDLYDLVWYLTDPSWPEPNLVMLNNALEQTKWTGDVLGSGNWREIVRQRILEIDVRKAVEDVRPFLERPRELEMLTSKGITALLER